ncbi:MAG: preprotein translocase subunit SecY [Planctomycetota bacterium]|nr:preprotein translocase subunit SecY [Planctomycetota bacterium]
MVFRAFRLIVGLILGALSAWLIGGSVLEIVHARGENLVAGTLLIPVLKIVAGLLVLALTYWALWAESSLRRALENIFSIPELLQKIVFTLALLCIYRIGFHVPLPGLDQTKIAEWMSGQEGAGGFGQAIAFYNMFTGGNLRQSTLFGLGIMPYISASIIFQLLTTVIPALERLQKEGPAGQKKIQEYIRYATVGLCLVQACVWMRIMVNPNDPLVYAQYAGSKGVFLMGVIGLTAGTVFLMWLGEQIDEYGIGNGISLLIMAGIVARMPWAIMELGTMVDFSLTGPSSTSIGPLRILVLMAMFVMVVAGAILITQGQRRIPIQQAKQMRGRRVYGGQRQYLPLRVNHGGVMPIIFASALMIFPNWLFGQMSRWWTTGWLGEIARTLADAFDMRGYTYAVVEIGLIFFFAYFWTTVQFRPKEMAEQLRDHGSFIPGLRPGRRTADYLERVMERITYCGAAFLAAIAVIPMMVNQAMGIPFSVSAFLGGTGLLIMVSVALDLVQRIESHLVMRNYGGFLGGSTKIKGAYG